MRIGAEVVDDGVLATNEKRGAAAKGCARGPLQTTFVSPCRLGPEIRISYVRRITVIKVRVGWQPKGMRDGPSEPQVRRNCIAYRRGRTEVCVPTFEDFLARTSGKRPSSKRSCFEIHIYL